MLARGNRDFGDVCYPDANRGAPFRWYDVCAGPWQPCAIFIRMGDALRRSCNAVFNLSRGRRHDLLSFFYQEANGDKHAVAVFDYHEIPITFSFD